MLKSDRITLRAIEPSDLETFYRWENDTSLWSLSCATAPYSRHLLQAFIASSDRTIYENGQLRLMISRNSDNATLGSIDLFDFDPHHRRAGVGVIVDPEFQRRGVAHEALLLLIDYAFNFLNLKQLFAHIPTNNVASRSLFLSADFKQTGMLVSWFRDGDKFVDVDVFQLIN